MVELAQWLRAQGLDDTAETLESAYAAERDIASLDDEDREAILLALADCPYGLSELRDRRAAAERVAAARGRRLNRRLGEPSASAAGNAASRPPKRPIAC